MLETPNPELTMSAICGKTLLPKPHTFLILEALCQASPSKVILKRLSSNDYPSQTSALSMGIRLMSSRVTTTCHHR
jgi:hypothetical protein